MFKDVSSVDERSARQVEQCLFSGPAVFQAMNNEYNIAYDYPA